MLPVSPTNHTNEEFHFNQRERREEKGDQRREREKAAVVALPYRPPP
jgi:hypothetical protein